MNEQQFLFYKSKINWGKHKTLPMMPGEAIKSMVKHYKMFPIAVGYYLDVIGVETAKQVILWKDDGVRVSWLGMLDKDTDKITLPKPKPEVKAELFPTYRALVKEINKRGYENIKGLKAKCTEEEYDEMLNVLPPLGWKNDTFYMSEFLSSELTLKFYKIGRQHMTEVVDYREEHPNLTEEEYLEQRY